MRKLLLATTALFGSVALSGAAHAMPAQTSPITLNVGGYVDFVAGFYDSSQGSALGVAESVPSVLGTTAPGGALSERGFETEYKLNFDAMGKASNGIQYGANVSLWNGPEVQNLWTGGNNGVEIASDYVWMSGAFGKAMFGGSHGATDLFVYAPTVGEGQVDGRYMDFVSPFFVARMQPSGIDNTEHSTNITYYTPKVGNDNNKVQAGITYEPNMYDYGSGTPLVGQSTSGFLSSSNFRSGTTSPYQDVIKGAAQYTGNFNPVNVAVSAQIITGSAGANNTGLASGLGNGVPMFAYAPNNNFQNFTAWGVGTQVGFNGFTVGGSYVNEGSYGAVDGQDKAQNVATLGAKYEFDKIGVGASWLTGQGYDNLLADGITGAPASTRDAGNYSNYVKSFNAEGIGATYTWFPGLTTSADGVMFQQKLDTYGAAAEGANDGYVFLISQKMTF